MESDTTLRVKPFLNRIQIERFFDMQETVDGYIQERIDLATRLF